MKIALKLFSFLLLLVLSNSILAQLGQYSTGVGLLEECKAAIRVLDSSSQDNTIDINTSMMALECLAYIDGISDMEAMYRNFLILEKVPIKKYSIMGCIPGNVTTDQKIRVIVKFLETHPGLLNVPSSGLIPQALSTTFPCPKEENSNIKTQ